MAAPTAAPPRVALDMLPLVIFVLLVACALAQIPGGVIPAGPPRANSFGVEGAASGAEFTVTSPTCATNYSVGGCAPIRCPPNVDPQFRLDVSERVGNAHKCTWTYVGPTPSADLWLQATVYCTP